MTSSCKYCKYSNQNKLKISKILFNDYDVG